MKKLILVIAALAFVGYYSKAQENNVNPVNNNTQQNNNNNDSRDKFQAGLKAGLNYSNVYDTKGEEFKTDAKFGFATGFFLAVPIGKFLGIQPEVLYSQKGFKATGIILNNTYDVTRTTSYIDVPLLASLKPVEYITLLAGPQYSYLIKQRDVFENATSTIEQEQEFKNDNLRRNTLCFLGGFDINYYHLVISTRVGWDILNNNGNGTTTTPQYKNVWYQLTLGYRSF
jgi:hypothetical protein